MPADAPAVGPCSRDSAIRRLHGIALAFAETSSSRSHVATVPIVTVATGDGGVDVIASRDPLSIEPPIIKVQCKRTTSTIGSPAVQQLGGALAHGGSELGLFV